MKAVVFHDIGDIRMDEVDEPQIREPHDAIISTLVTAICGTDLHMVRGTMGGMQPGTILGHEAVGVVERVGPAVRNLSEGERVVVTSTIACGYCSYCRAGYFAQCDNANPNGAHAGTCFFGGPKSTGPVHGLQAEKARIPFANVTCVPLPPDVSDEEGLMLSDIFPTGYFGADIAEIHDGDTVAVFGCGPVGLFAILSAQLHGAARVLAVDHLPDRLSAARDLGAETINFDEEDPVEALMEQTGGIGCDRAIDAVGVDAEPPESGPAAAAAHEKREQYRREVRQVAPESEPRGDLWQPGQAPSIVLEWAVQGLCKAGTLSVIGVYPPTVQFFPWGAAMNKNLTINAGNCNHRRYLPRLIDLVRSGVVNVEQIISKVEPFESVIDAYETFDTRRDGWIKVELAMAEAM